MTRQEEPPSAAPPVQQVPWWLGRGVGLALIAMVAGVGWVFSWGVAAETTQPAPQVTYRWDEVNAVTSTVSRTITGPPGERASGAGALNDDQGLHGTDSPQPVEPHLTAAQGRAHREIRRTLRQARIERAERRDRELAAFIEAAGLLQEMWVTPISSLYRITATFGATGSLWSADHTGVDLAAPSGTPVVTVAAGTVTSAEHAGAYGLRVAVAHADGTETWYAHLSWIDVSVGQQIEQGQQIGAVGVTGNVTGPHLHLELRLPGGVAVDPVAALRARGVELEPGQ